METNAIDQNHSPLSKLVQEAALVKQHIKCVATLQNDKYKQGFTASKRELVCDFPAG